MTTALEASGYTIEITRQYEEFASVTVGHNEQAVVIDLGLDWWENSPAIIDIGPILSLKDSVASKLLAVYSRGYARDHLDAHSIITSHRFTHQQLIALCQRRDRTLDLPTFALPSPDTPPPNSPNTACNPASFPPSAPASWTSPRQSTKPATTTAQ